jgi:hypothetical protein
VHTAGLLGISRNVVRTLLKRYGLINDADAEAALPDEVGFEPLRHAGLFGSCGAVSH